MRLRILWLSLISLLVTAGAAFAHEVRPAYLEITERNGGKVDVLFKQPSANSLTVRLEPEISGGLLFVAPQVEAGPSFQTRIWRGLKADLNGRTVTVHGLDRSITDALVIVHYADGHDVQQILKPENATLELGVRGSGLPVVTYITLGIEHILSGYDHLMFVLGLVLLVRGVPTLLKTITAFTVAHSITLAITALGVVQVEPAKIEALVALSIVFVSVELTNVALGRSSLTQRWPWLIAFAFGLLHGSAFASALSQIGLPQDNIPLALLFFNVGVEIGQLLFVAVVLLVIFGLKRLKVPERLQPYPRLRPALEALPTYAIGMCAAFWFLERIHTAIA